MTTSVLESNCPNCSIEIQWTDKYPERPFCSERCKNNDFIGWANEEKKIAGNSSYEDVFSEDGE
mgnify:FL=1|tara:strand:+ start:4754 stop:4945 length:192 start_codon:yes stop_codon:yes gene_type:complete